MVSAVAPLAHLLYQQQQQQQIQLKEQADSAHPGLGVEPLLARELINRAWSISPNIDR